MEVADACFMETSTLGLRWHQEDRIILKRQAHRTDDGIGVKSARRPGGIRSTKAEADDIAKAASGHYERGQLRQKAEASVKDID